MERPGSKQGPVGFLAVRGNPLDPSARAADSVALAGSPSIE